MLTGGVLKSRKLLKGFLEDVVFEVGNELEKPLLVSIRDKS